MDNIERAVNYSALKQNGASCDWSNTEYSHTKHAGYKLRAKARSVFHCIKLLGQGKIIIYPTESSYAIGCDATNPEAIRKVRAVKGRDTKPIAVIVDSLETAEKYCYLTEEEKLLSKKHHPGPLTICAKKKENVPDTLNKERFSFRIPSNETALELAKSFSKPITATSANLSGQPPIFKIDEINKVFKGKVSFIIDAGDLPNRKPSTIIEDGVIIREGAIQTEEI